jgi:integrase
MSDANSTLATPRSKPAKPYPDFPLFAHAVGVWAKKIHGRLHYFGPWDDPDGALKKYMDQKDDLHAGRTPRPSAGALIVKELANTFLAEKQNRVDAGEITKRTWTEYKEACDLIVAEFGARRLVSDLRPDDFTSLRKRMAARWGPVRLGNMIQYVRSVFKFGYDCDLLDRPMRFGPFKKPTKKVLRIHRAQQGVKLFTAEEVRRLLDAAGQPMRAMIFLGINAGFGMSDCGTLPLSALDLDGGWVNFPRPKTGIDRRCRLWPETVQAIRDALALRPKPKDPGHVGLVFLTAQGWPWFKGT